MRTKVGERPSTVEHGRAALPRALSDFRFRAAAAALWDVVTEANRVVSATRPWELAKAADGGDAAASEQLDVVLAALLRACGVVAQQLTSFLPGAAERIRIALDGLDAERGRVLFPKPRLPSARPLGGG